MDAQGNCRFRFHANVAGASGIGTTTGLQFILVGASDVAFPPSPCSQVVPAPPTLIYTLVPTTSNNLWPPDPCDVTFGLSVDENGQINVSIQLVEVPTGNSGQPWLGSVVEALPSDLTFLPFDFSA